LRGFITQNSKLNTRTLECS